MQCLKRASSTSVRWPDALSSGGVIAQTLSLSSSADLSASLLISPSPPSELAGSQSHPLWHQIKQAKHVNICNVIHSTSASVCGSVGHPFGAALTGCGFQHGPRPADCVHSGATNPGVVLHSCPLQHA